MSKKKRVANHSCMVWDERGRKNYKRWEVREKSKIMGGLKRLEYMFLKGDTRSLELRSLDRYDNDKYCKDIGVETNLELRNNLKK